MKKFLVISQVIYLLCVIPWVFIWGISFMGFDQGFSWYAVALVVGIGVYPIAVILCSIFAWKLRKHRKRAAIIVNLIPMVWVLGIGLPVSFLNFS
ncbi:hypothetical protein [Cohnella silvisoli]|uniref:Uncharacterized protein n=1 Tax=Cohnella silvisoli TaxID=2873699 RepID=A0ABV1L200_9BACL|nr:hypothetical protein [Cohnella silvisoli]MCD9025253.1 hypothetical protein [Cohnella silvisoli]